MVLSYLGQPAAALRIWPYYVSAIFDAASQTTVSYQRDGHSDPSPATNMYHQMETYPYQGFAHPSQDVHTGSSAVSNQGDVPFDPITNTY